MSRDAYPLQTEHRKMTENRDYWREQAQRQRSRADEMLRMLKSAESLLREGDFSNGNTHPDGHGPDEGSVMAGRMLERIRAAIAKAEGRE